MISDNPAFDEFINQHRWAVLSTQRRSGGVSSSMVAYARDGDRLLVSTPGGTFKRQSLAQDPHATLCVISNAEPFHFVTIEGTASIITTDIREDTRRVFANIAGTGYTEPEDLPSWLAAQRRVIIEISAARVSDVIR